MKILVVEDDPTHADKIAEPFDSASDEVVKARNLQEAVEMLHKTWPDIVILDAMFPRNPPTGRWVVPTFMAGEFLNSMDNLCAEKGAERPDVLLVSGQDEAAKRFNDVADWLHDERICDVLPKGIANVGWGFFQAVLKNRLGRLRRERELRHTVRPIANACNSLAVHHIFTQDFEMANELWKNITIAVKAGHTVLIHGEKGTGKDLVARAIGKIRQRGYKAINCDGFPIGLFESEFFGTVRGAGTNLIDRAGRIEDAADGVLFLDEISSVPLECQGKLLRVLESNTREFSRLGENRVRQARCMFVFADKTHPRDAEAQGKMRPDLADRIRDSLLIKVPPLRERRSDIPLLMEHFLHIYKRQSGFDKPLGLSEEVKNIFQNGPWPGNVRLLATFIRTIVLKYDQNSPALVRWTDVKRAIDERDLADELGASAVSRITGVSVTQIPSDMQDLLTQLSIELAYEVPATWLALKKDSDEDMILRALTRLLNGTGKRLLGEFKEFLENRETHDPRRIHCYKALLYLALRPDHEVVLKDFAQILGVNPWPQSAKVGEALTSFRLGTTEALVSEKAGTPRNRKVYCLMKDLIPVEPATAPGGHSA